MEYREYKGKNVDEAMNDDFNSPKALSYLFEIFKKMQKKLDNNDASVVRDYNGVKLAYKVLGLFKNDTKNVLDFISQKQDNDLPEVVLQMAEKRWQAKQNRDFAQADNLRGELLKMGFVILDKKDGYEVKKQD